jgi:hypothetical protein
MGDVDAQLALRRMEIARMSASQQTAFVFQQFSQLTAGAARHSRTMFEIHKGAAIGETIMNTHRAAEGAYAALAGIPYIGPGLGIAAALFATASGIARVNDIKKQQFGSSGSVGSIGGSGMSMTSGGGHAPGMSSIPPSPVSASAARATEQRTPLEMNVTIIGNPSRQDIAELFDAINTGIRDGHTITGITLQ